MSMKPAKVYVGRYPAYDIHLPRDFHHTAAIVKAEQQFAVYFNEECTGRYVLVTANSAAAYAMSYNDCPVASYNREKERGNPTHWLNTNATCLSNMKEEKREYVALHVGQWVYFEGRYFAVDRAPNDNFKLTEQ